MIKVEVLTLMPDSAAPGLESSHSIPFNTER
jgi:hypothetical protein